jgi:ATPase subunit of ABC transporter with duplicated ATPase domains
MITVNHLGMHFGDKTLFEDVSFQLNPGNRYGLVGANGSGKSTLVRIIAGEVTPESGSVQLPSSLKIGVLKQDQSLYRHDRIIDVVLKGNRQLWSALQEKCELLERNDQTLVSGEKLAHLEMLIADLGGYEAEAEAAEILAGLGIPEARQADLMLSLSGGYRLRVLLAQCLFSRPDFLLLDEPNNHLDMASIIWLEEYLCRFPGTCLIISHDQYFLNRISTHIVDIDYETVKIYPGNYFHFLQEKTLEHSQREAEIVRQEKKREEIQAFVTRFKAKATKARQANSKVKQLDRMEEIVIKRSSRIAPAFVFDICRPSGKVALTARGVGHWYGDIEVLREVTFTLKRGEKMAIIGPNGVGKSTLLKILGGVLLPAAGGVEAGHEIHQGYCPQDHHDILPADTTPYEWLYRFGPAEPVGRIRGLLGRVLIQGDDAHKSTAALSGGEAARLIFARMMLERPNMLLLDEPTNHMDIESLEALGSALQTYQGTIVCVSHDRRFIEQFATVILELRRDGFDLFAGGYREYIEKAGVDYLERGQTSLSAGLTVRKAGGKKPDSQAWREMKKEIGRLKSQVARSEGRIASLEDKIQAMEERLADVQLYQPGQEMELQKVVCSKEQLQADLAEAGQEWEAQQAALDRMTMDLNRTVRN